MLFTFVFTLFRSSDRRCFIKKAVLKNFAMFTWKRLCWSLCLIRLQTFRSVTLLNRDSGVFMWLLRNIYFEELLRTAASVYSEDLLKCKNCIIKNMLSESFWVYKEKCIYKKNLICKEKSGAVKKVLKLRSIISFILEIWY